MPTAEIPELLDKEQAAAKLRMTSRTLLRLRRENEWPCVRIGTQVYFRPEHVQRILDDLTEDGRRSA